MEPAAAATPPVLSAVLNTNGTVIACPHCCKTYGTGGYPRPSSIKKCRCRRNGVPGAASTTTAASASAPAVSVASPVVSAVQCDDGDDDDGDDSPTETEEERARRLEYQTAMALMSDEPSATPPTPASGSGSVTGGSGGVGASNAAPEVVERRPSTSHSENRRQQVCVFFFCVLLN